MFPENIFFAKKGHNISKKGLPITDNPLVFYSFYKSRFLFLS